MTSIYPPKDIIRRFCSHPDTAEVTILGQGNINDTFLIRTQQQALVLQRINDQVFPDPQILIDNLQHLSRHLQSQADTSAGRWEEAILIPARDGSLAVQDNEGKVWRALSYIHGSISFSHTETLLQAEQTGWALGHFHKRLVGLDLNKMQIPLPGFHSLPEYLRHYKQVITVYSGDTSADIQFCMEIINQEQEGALTLEHALATGKIQQNIIHGDPKIANVLFDRKSRLAISLIDLDTVGPGLLQHDIGDCLRSVCNSGGEESHPEQVAFDLERCERALNGYFQEAGQLLSPIDRELIYDGIKTMAFELGLRFFTDYLQGSIYFKCVTPEETLRKALVQFFLLQDIIAKEDAIRKLTLPGDSFPLN
jgi:Ser/Thr protein kinase RdoA (MazF antagonist)